MQSFPQLLNCAPRNCRIPKCLPHLLLDCEISVYHDGAFRMQVDPQVAAGLLGNCDLAMFGHPGGHRSIHDERNFYQGLHGYVPEDVEKQYQRYVAEGLHDTGQFWAGGFIVRRHCEAVERFNEIWFREYLEGSVNDQFSLYSAVVKSGVRVATIPGDVIMDPRFGYCLHADSGCQDNVSYEAENARWSARVARIRELSGC